MATTLTIGGVGVNLARNQLGRLVAFSKGGYPTLTLTARTGFLPAVPDPWLHAEAVLTINGTVRFKGDVVSAHPNYGHLGWEIAYQCIGLRHRGDRFPHTDATTGIDSSGYNLQSEDPAYDPTRAGRTVGQVLTSVLTMDVNAQAMIARGLGGITGSVGSYALPTDTAADLAALAVIPPAPVSVRGEKFLGAVESFLSEWAPNHLLWIDPATGHIRVLDTRTFVNHTFTMGTDPVDPSELSRDLTECYQRVVVRGQPIAVMGLLKLSDSQLTEDFGHDGLSNSAAKTAWSPSDWRTPTASVDTGTCTCPTTTTVQYTSSLGSKTFAANILDQSHQQATVQLSSTIISDYTQFWTARVTSNTSLTAGGNCTLTIDAPLPHTSFNKATISYQPSAGVVWTQYAIVNTQLWSRLTTQSTYPQAFVNSAGGETTLSSPLGLIKRADGVTAPLPFVINKATGRIRFVAPTYIVGNNQTPLDVWAYLPFYSNPNSAVSPADVAGVPQYAGTSHTIDGMAEPLTITLESWRDPAQLSQVVAYATDLLDSVKDAIVEGTITYHGLYDTALTPGIAASVTGSDFTTGWESAALPVIGVELDWPAAGPMMHQTTLHCSNRKAHLSAASFLRPERTFLAFGGEAQPMGEGVSGFQESIASSLPTGATVGASSPASVVGAGLGGMAPGDLGGFGPGDMGSLGGGFGGVSPGDMGGYGPAAQGGGDATGTPNNPGDYLRGGGMSTNPGDYLRGQGLPTGPGAASGISQPPPPPAPVEAEDHADTESDTEEP